MNRNKKGFTLVEIMVVMIIIATLIAVMFPYFGNIINRSKRSKMRVEMQKLKKEVIKYNLKYNYWPSNLNDLEGEFIIKVPKNPDGVPFKLKYQIYSIYVVSESNDPMFAYSLYIGKNY